MTSRLLPGRFARSFQAILAKRASTSRPTAASSASRERLPSRISDPRSAPTPGSVSPSMRSAAGSTIAPIAGSSSRHRTRRRRPAAASIAPTPSSASTGASAARRFRAEVGIAGDTPARVRPYVEIPESFRRRYAEMRSSNDLLALIASLGILALAIAGIVFLSRSARAKRPLARADGVARDRRARARRRHQRDAGKLVLATIPRCRRRVPGAGSLGALLMGAGMRCSSASRSPRRRRPRATRSRGISIGGSCGGIAARRKSPRAWPAAMPRRASPSPTSRSSIW